MTDEEKDWRYFCGECDFELTAWQKDNWFCCENCAYTLAYRITGPKDDGLTEYQKYVNNWNSAPIKTYERPLISNFTDPIYDDARTHEVVDSKEI